MRLLQILTDLSQCIGVSGAEEQVSEYLLAQMKPYTTQCHVDAFHNVIGVVQPAKFGQKHIVLDAHLDEIGMIVTAIEEGGFLRVSPCGGVDRRLLPGQEVTVHGKTILSGVVATLPPHLTDAKDSDSIPAWEDILIDVGMSKEQAKELISPGDRITLCGELQALLGDCVTGRALDDRCAVAILLYVMEQLQGKELPFGLTVLCSSREEAGQQGATVAAFRCQPDIAISLDVSFAWTPDASRYQCGVMDEGVMIGIAPSLHRDVTDRLVELAKEQDIPHQLEVMGGSTGTNADVIGVQCGGVQTALLSIPLKYMHTPVETVSLKDCQATADLLLAYLLDQNEK